MGTVLERGLAVLSDVRKGEGPKVIAFAANLFLVLVAYYLLKTLREPLVLVTGGAELKAYAAGVQAVLLMALVPLYSRLASRVDTAWLVRFVTIAFVVCIELFALGSALRVPYLGFVFFVFTGLFGVAAVAQFWSFANDLYDVATGDRLFPIIGLGATVGSAAGAVLASRLFASGLSVVAMLHLAAALVVVHLALYAHAQRRFVEDAEEHVRPAPLAAADGFALVAKSPFLRWFAVLLVVMNLVNTNGEFVLGDAVLRSARDALALAQALGPVPDPDAFQHAYVGRFYGDFFTGVNIAAVLLQAFVASRLVKYGGLRSVLFFLPLVSLLTYGAAALGASFLVFRIAKSSENAADYSIMNTGKALLWLPTTREEKYKAKQALDTFFVRFGDVVSAVLVALAVDTLGLGAEALALANIVLVVGWAVVAYVVCAEHGRLAVAQGSRS